MSAIILFSLISLILFFTLSFSSRHGDHNHHPSTENSSVIHMACQSTRFPERCEAAITNLPPNQTTVQIIQSAISVSFEDLQTAESMVKSILESSKTNPNRTVAANVCLEVLSYADHRTESANDGLTRGKIKDARAWMSAALVYQYDCWGALSFVNDTKPVVDTMSFLNSLMQQTSNALSMMFAYDNYGDDITTWAPPKTERDGFYEKGSGGSDLNFTGGVPTNLKPDVTVCTDGGNGGCYKTVQEAVNAAPENAEPGCRFVIYIKEGVYEEIVRVPITKKKVVFLGDGIGKTIITGSLNVGQPGMITYNSATVGE